ncbi:MAG: PQQ-binding-like beta-propeller repeat protein, partial [Planctomycetota bacterium]
MKAFPRSAPLLSLAVILCIAEAASAQDWTRFRGPNGSGVIEATGLPVSFGHTENVLWRAEVPHGRSSPVLAGKNIFLTGADEEHLITICIDRERGTVRWRRTKERTRTEEVYSANDSASPTPATDGTNVYAFFPELGVVSYDATGKERWTHPLGPFVSFYGMASSPILAGDTLLLACDQQSGSFLLALDANTGETRWRVDRRIVESWTTPVLHPAQNPKQVILFGCFAIHGYSIETGEELWTMGGVGYTPVCSPLIQGNRLFISVPYHAEQPMPDFATLSATNDKNEDGMLSKAEMVDTPMGEHFGWADADKDGMIDAREWDFVSK